MIRIMFGSRIEPKRFGKPRYLMIVEDPTIELLRRPYFECRGFHDKEHDPFPNITIDDESALGLFEYLYKHLSRSNDFKPIFNKLLTKIKE